MSDDEKRFRRRVEKTCDEILTQLDQLRDRVLALRRGAAGENPVGEVIALFNELWINLHARGQADARYDFTKADAGNIKRWLKTMDTLTLKGRVTRYFLDRTPWLMHNRHPFNYFVTHFNTYSPGLATSQTLAYETAVDCQHQPACRTDAEHTMRRAQEMRA